MNAVGLTTAAFALPRSAAAVATSFAATNVAAVAANDTAPLRRPAAAGPVTLPARLQVERRRASAVDVSISREKVMIFFPDAAVATRPIRSYRGVTVTVEGGDGEPLFRLTLEHEEREHSVPLSSGSDVEVIAREWQAWAKALSLPLIAVDAEGNVHAELNALGVVLAEHPVARRRGSPLVGRRSRYGRKRRGEPLTRSLEAAPVHAGEREIIART